MRWTRGLMRPASSARWVIAVIARPKAMARQGVHPHLGRPWRFGVLSRTHARGSGDSTTCQCVLVGGCDGVISTCHDFRAQWQDRCAPHKSLAVGRAPAQAGLLPEDIGRSCDGSECRRRVKGR